MQVPGSNVSVRSDLSATLFLAEPDEYDGGELEIESAFGIQAVKLEAGDMILYPSSSLHRVTPVTRGARIAVVFLDSRVWSSDEAARTLVVRSGSGHPGLDRPWGGTMRICSN
jgi:PKHD-type hydroxylase